MVHLLEIVIARLLVWGSLAGGLPSRGNGLRFGGKRAVEEERGEIRSSLQFAVVL